MGACTGNAPHLDPPMTIHEEMDEILLFYFRTLQYVKKSNSSLSQVENCDFVFACLPEIEKKYLAETVVHGHYA